MPIQIPKINIKDQSHRNEEKRKAAHQVKDILTQF
jgi:hypothetical protein